MTTGASMGTSTVNPWLQNSEEISWVVRDGAGENHMVWKSIQQRSRCPTVAPGPCLDNSRYTHHITRIIFCVIDLRVMWPPTDGRRWRPHTYELWTMTTDILWSFMANSPCRNWPESPYQQEPKAYYGCHRFWYRTKCLFVFRLINSITTEADKTGTLSSVTRWTHLSIEHFRCLVSFGDLQLLEHRSWWVFPLWYQWLAEQPPGSRTSPFPTTRIFVFSTSFWGLRSEEWCAECRDKETSREKK